MAQVTAPTIILKSGYKKGDNVEVRVKVKYNSTTGLKFVDGKFLPADKPADYISKVEIFYGKELVSQFDLTAATSPNPLFRFRLTLDKAEPIKAVATNNGGQKAEATQAVSF